MESLKARLLISSAGLYDPNFRHTVVVIASHNDEGAVGVILNRPTELLVADAVPPLAELTEPGATLFEGGPVEQSQPVLLVELKDSVPVDLPIFGNIGFLTGEVDNALRPSVVRARVFAGYAGWGAGQLEAELAADSWIIEPAKSEDLFTSDPESLWKRVLERKGGSFRRMAMVPKDPRVN